MNTSLPFSITASYCRRRSDAGATVHAGSISTLGASLPIRPVNGDSPSVVGAVGVVAARDYHQGGATNGPFSVSIWIISTNRARS